MRTGRRAAGACLAAVIAAGCGQDCFEAKRMGDFEFSQGNYPNAIRHYLKSLEADPACEGVKVKLDEARAREAGAIPGVSPGTPTP